MSERQQAEMLLDNIPEKSLHIVIALMRELTEYDDYIECALDEADYLAEHTTERMTHEEVFSDLHLNRIIPEKTEDIPITVFT